MKRLDGLYSCLSASTTEVIRILQILWDAVGNMFFRQLKVNPKSLVG